jgi:hypothetical protein
MVQSHVSYRWTTSQYQSTRAPKQELSIIANPKADRQTRAPTGTERMRHPTVAADQRQRMSSSFMLPRSGADIESALS